MIELAQPTEPVPAWKAFAPRIALCLVALTWCGCLVLMARPHLGNMTDDGEYYVAALALAQGKGYTLPSRPDAQTTKYPPGLSLTVAPVLYFFPGYNAARVVVTLFGILLLFAGFKFLRNWGLGEWEAVLLMIPVMFQPSVLFWAMILVSDVPFAAIVLTFFCIKPDDRKRIVLLGALAAYAYLLRSNGLTLLLAGVLISRRRTLYFLCGFALVTLPVKIVLGRGRGETYWDNFQYFARADGRQVVELLAGNAWGYLRSFALWIYPIVETNALQRLGIALIVATVIAAIVPMAMGLRELSSRDRWLTWPFGIHTLASVAIFTTWPWYVGIRAFIWLGPALLFCWYRGWGKYRRYALAFTLLCAVAMAGMTVRRNHRTADPDLDAAIDFLKTSTPADAVVASYMPEATFLYTGRQGCRFLLDGDHMAKVAGNWAPILACAQNRPLYLLVPVEGYYQPQSAALIRNAARPLVPEYRNEHFNIYRIE